MSKIEFCLINRDTFIVWKLNFCRIDFHCFLLGWIQYRKVKMVPCKNCYFLKKCLESAFCSKIQVLFYNFSTVSASNCQSLAAKLFFLGFFFIWGISENVFDKVKREPDCLLTLTAVFKLWIKVDWNWLIHHSSRLLLHS